MLQENSTALPTLFTLYPWYVIHCKSGREKFAAEIIRSQLGLVAYVPEMKTWEKDRVRFIPLFPGYFFLQVDLVRTALSQINASPGVLRLLTYDGIPQGVPSHFVEMLRVEAARLDKYSAAVQDFRPDDPLYVIDGPLRGLEAVFVGSTPPGRRVQILLKFLGRLTKVEVERSVLEKRGEETQVRRERYTRGKGRKIRREETA